MNRKEAQEIALVEIKRSIAENGEDTIAMACPQLGKNTWTWKELLESTINDTPLENYGNENIIDLMIKYHNYKQKQNGAVQNS